jgi:signal transduction histidine kinase
MMSNPAIFRVHRQVAVDALSAIDRMECTVNDVLDFRKLDANLFKMSPQRVDVGAVVDSICRHCRSFLLPNVDLQYRVLPRGAWASVDARRLHQIVVNGLRWVVPGSGLFFPCGSLFAFGLDLRFTPVGRIRLFE